MRKFIATSLMLVLLTAATGFAQADDELSLGPSGIRWLVKFGPDVSDETIDSIAERYEAERVNLGPFADFTLFVFDQVPRGEILATFLATPGMVYAERETRYITSANYMLLSSNDPLKPFQWSHRMINLDKALALNYGSDPSVTIALLDTGVAYLNTSRVHMAPDLSGTIFYDGYDFVSDDELAIDEGDGKLGHGTFMAGVIAQTTHNARGTAGIAFNAAMLPVRVANRRGVTRSTDLARGIRYSVANGADIIVIAVSGPADSRAVREAVEFAYDNGVAVIASAGNFPEVGFPARYRQVLSVGAVDAAGEKAWYSPQEGPVDIYAPGGDLRAGVDADANGRPDGILAESFTARKFDRFYPVAMEGTSAAAAHVAGVAALLLSHVDHISPDSLYLAIRTTAQGDDNVPLLDAGALMMRVWFDHPGK